MAHRIIPRAEWGARFNDGFGNRTIGHLDKVLHHSVTQAPDLVPPFDDDYDAIRALEAIGESRFGGGISYTFPITPAGLIFQGHSIGRIGSHTAGRNSTSVGIVLVGNYENQPVTPEQDSALAWLLNEGVTQQFWRLNTITWGHRDLKATACPGKNAYDRIAHFNALADGTAIPVDNPINDAPPPPPPPPPPPAPVAPPFPLGDGQWFGWKAGGVNSISGYYSHREDLRRWQQHMKDRGWGIGVDGLYGPNTNEVTVLFQREKHLLVDGKIGPKTWAAAWTAPVT